MRTLRLRTGAFAAGAALLAFTVPSAGSSGATAPRASGPLPHLPAYLGVGVRYLRVRPANIVYTGDGSGVLSGPKPGESIHWSSWRTQTAFGGGYNLIDNCRPDCARGRYDAYPVKLEAWKPGLSHGELVFTRLTILYTATAPAGQPAHYTFTTSYANGWGLGPPGVDGYCTHTDGQPKAPGCANIAALPPGPLGQRP